MIAADLAKPEECTCVVNETIQRQGDVDILVHPAGLAAPGSLLNVSQEVWYHAFNIHIHAAFHLCQAAVPSVKKKGRSAVIFISSVAGVRGVKNALSYAVAKGALPQFTRALAFQLGDDKIKVNCVSPGVIRTRFQNYLTPEQEKNNIENHIPLHREGKTRRRSGCNLYAD
jgi:NAD(P)-dependent dehydrogenase (short-subunit alcohol dehydrogenase family)